MSMKVKFNDVRKASEIKGRISSNAKIVILEKMLETFLLVLELFLNLGCRYGFVHLSAYFHLYFK